ncbi:MAG: gliding motility lipoprotein GldB [Cytophagales bacterium CG12_big_fil_rev_8_21_14_0_65_40_12]|nr:MAG: gliding motility lipoprotein GldB [Cytophagales bacterium CG12_big_fil_rev_8_21_14_0_65_40_12]PIW05841.1 MAG: gliding motility lipoprotein GldB [Cytophagales bacterium CG17_big_fil_post_rev_8_21_14_2_50_40_13]
MNKSWFIIALLFLVMACGEDSDCPAVPNIELELSYESLVDQIHDVEDTFALKNFFKANPILRDFFFLSADYPSESAMVAEVFGLLKNPFVDTLYQQTKLLINEEQLEQDLTDAFKRIKSYYPDYKVPKVQTVYSAFGNDVFFSDSLLVIGLDYYLGNEASYRPNVYDYLKARLTPEHLVPQIVQFTSLKFNTTEQGQRTVLDEMVYYGKALEFTKTILPCTADSLIIGYSGEALASSIRSEGFLWSYFVDKALLYDKTPANLSRYIDERPGIPEIDPICPGRIGQWIGWQIVRKYRDEEDLDFTDLMKETDPGKVLMQSKYRPRNR